MDAVRREAAAPPPIPFPWKRALPGLVVAGLALVLILIRGIAAIAQLGNATTPRSFPRPCRPCTPPIFHGGIGSAAIWTVLALLVALGVGKTLDARCFRQDVMLGNGAPGVSARPPD